jgi:hypothetical protein
MLTSKTFWSSAADRAIKTFAQTALALLGTSQVISTIEVDWVEVGGVSLFAAILSVLTSVSIPAGETKASVFAETAAKEAAIKAAATKTAAKKSTKK